MELSTPSSPISRRTFLRTTAVAAGAVAAGVALQSEAVAGGSADHFYTTSVAEWDGARQAGWYDETWINRFYVFPRPTSYQGRGTSRLYRLYNRSINDHFYTVDYSEAVSAISGGGYSDESSITPMYVFADFPRPLLVSCRSLYRMWSDRATDHFYTTNTDELNGAVSAGYRNETYESTRMWVFDSPVVFSGVQAVPVFRLYHP